MTLVLKLHHLAVSHLDRYLFTFNFEEKNEIECEQRSFFLRYSGDIMLGATMWYISLSIGSVIIVSFSFSKVYASAMYYRWLPSFHC